MVDREFIDRQFGNAKEYKDFVFQYLESRDLPAGVQRLVDELEK